jgi:hypothetical protein
MSRLGLGTLAALALPVVLGASGCHTFKYVDMTVSFDQSVDDADILAIHDCRMLVTGADSDSFLIASCPPAPTVPDPHVGPVFEFSTFADSGTLHFEFKGFQGLVETPDCLVLDGKQDVPVTSMTTIPASINVTKTGMGCQNNVTPPSDGGGG